MASILSKKKKKKKKKNKREKYSISELKTLGHQLLSSRAHINNLPLLMSFVCSGTSPPYYALEALLSVQSFFTHILPDLPSHPQGDPQDPEFIYRTWLRSKFDDFVNSLIDIAVSPQSKEALRVYFTYITIEKLARTLGAKDISDNKIVSVDGNNKSHSRTSKAEHEMWNGSGVFIKEGDHKEHSRYPKADDKQNKVEQSSNNVLSAVNIAKKMKLKFTKAWISFLRLPLPVDLYKEVLVTLHQAVIPYLSNPIMLCDFLTRSYDIGGVISVMALSSLYILMTQHGLEYPNFYEKLFAENGSSLWEIDTLRHHYCPPVSRFVLSLENDLTVRSKTTEVAVKDFSSGSYATIFRAEIGRRVKQVPLAFYKATPSSLFSESDFAGWTFKYKENDELFTSGVDNKNIDISEDHGHGSAKRQRIECS
ncbi:unnamed protein product [Camellia sinensis]